MAQHCLFGFMIVLGCVLLEVSPRPSNNEPAMLENFESLEEPTKIDNANDKEERSLIYNPIDSELPDDATKDILEKIQAINEALKKPHKKQQFKWPTEQPPTDGGYNLLDKDTLEKLKEVIASGKLHSYHEASRQQEINSIYDDNSNLIRQNRQMQQLLAMNKGMQGMPIPYITNIPVLVMPTVSNMYNGLPNNINPDSGLYQTRQSPAPSSPFQFQWPFAQFFPLLIKDPFLSIMSGAGWSNLFEYGQSADVCSRKHTDDHYLKNDITENKHYIKSKILDLSDSVNSNRLRQKRSVKKRTISHSATSQSLENLKNEKTIFITKPSRKPVKQITTTPQPDQKPHSAKIEDAEEGDLRFPFSDFTLFGNKKPVAPSPGFFINRLKVRRGGVAIAGPGGVATAGRGGTAIVGPGGLAYTQPGGVAVAGPAARVIALSEDADLSSIVSRLQKQSAIDDSTGDQDGEASYEDMELEDTGRRTTGIRMNINTTD